MPLSIIIVGVGDADFEMMEQLDGDVTPLYSKGMRKYRDRDIVQFVSFKEFKNDPQRLAKEILAEVPRQMTDYFIHKGIMPNPKLLQDRAAVAIRNKMKNQMANMMKVSSDFFSMRKNEIVQKCQQQMGFDPNQLNAFIDQIGIPEENLNWIVNYKDNQGYFNAMKQ